MKRIRARSKKQEALYRLRRPFVAAFLEKYPWCQRCLNHTANGFSQLGFHRKSTEVHEKVTRARGGDILDPDNCVAVCHPCHMEVHAHPAQATADGFLKSGKKQFSFRS